MELETLQMNISTFQMKPLNQSWLQYFLLTIYFDFFVIYGDLCLI